MRFEGDRDFSQEPAQLWPKMRDARFLVECVPDSTSDAPGTLDQAQCTVRPGFSFVRGTLDVTLRITESQEPTLLKILLTSKGIGSSSDVEATLTFAVHGEGTRIHWLAEIKNLGGLLKMVPSGLIRGAAQKVIDDVWASVQQKLG